MPVVHEDIDLPGGTAPVAEVKITLAGVGCQPFTGTVPPDVRILGTKTLRQGAGIDQDGYWEINLTGNDDIDPPGTVYRVSRRVGDSRTWIDTCISVPVSGGPYSVTSRQTEPPGSLPTPVVADLQARVTELETGVDTTAAPFIGGDVGTGAPPVGGFGSDRRGLLTWGTGTGPTAGEMAGIDYEGDYTPIPRMVLTPANAVTAALGVYVSQAQTWGFVVGVANAPAASQPADTYQVHYIVEL